MTGARLGDIIISFALFFFAFTTIMAYYYYAETNLVYLFSRIRLRRLNAMRTMVAAERDTNGPASTRRTCAPSSTTAARR